jgi:hypothetical protein
MSDSADGFLSAKFSANELRVLAEAADALRNDDACIVENPDKSADAPRYTVMLTAAAKAQGLTPIVGLLTTDGADEASKRREKVILSTDRPITFLRNPKLSLADCDAVFLTLSAVDKFVVPYYVRTRGLREVQALREAFASNEKAAMMIHLPWSEPDIAVVGG